MHRNLLFIMLYMTLLADKENLSFIYQEEPKHSAGHHCQYLSNVDYYSAPTFIKFMKVSAEW